MDSMRGYTLIELLLALAVAGVLAALGLPALSNTLEATRSAAAEAHLLASLTRSIQRAAITGTRSVLCPSRDGAGCAEGPDWSGGWIAFLDPDGDRERGPRDILILSEPALPGAVRLFSTTGRTRIVFQGNGGNAGSNVTFTLCDGRGWRHARSLVLNNQGRLRHGTPGALAAQRACPP